MSDSLSLCSRCAIFYASTIPPSPRGASGGDFFSGQQPIQMARNHLFSNRTLDQCEESFFQRKIGIRSEGFLCQRGIDPGIFCKLQWGCLDSKTLFLDSSCPPT